MRSRDMHEVWRHFVDQALAMVGSFWSFIVAVAFLLGWLAAGSAMGFSNTWQLVLNTVASVIAFLLVFLIQYSQNRDTRSIQLKLDEIVRSIEARERFVRLEKSTDEELDELEADFDERRSKRH